MLCCIAVFMHFDATCLSGPCCIVFTNFLHTATLAYHVWDDQSFLCIPG